MRYLAFLLALPLCAQIPGPITSGPLNLNTSGQGYIAPFPPGYPLASPVSVTNQGRFFQFVIPVGMTVAKASISITTAVASSNFRIGIYSSPCSGASTLLSQSAVASSAAAGTVTAALSQALTPGVYVLGLTFDANGVAYYENYGPTALLLGGTTLIATGTVSTGTAGTLALPTSCGTLAPLFSSYFPGVVFQP